MAFFSSRLAFRALTLSRSLSYTCAVSRSCTCRIYLYITYYATLQSRVSGMWSGKCRMPPASSLRTWDPTQLSQYPLYLNSRYKTFHRCSSQLPQNPSVRNDAQYKFTKNLMGITPQGRFRSICIRSKGNQILYAVTISDFQIDLSLFSHDALTYLHFVSRRCLAFVAVRSRFRARSSTSVSRCDVGSILFGFVIS